MRSALYVAVIVLFGYVHPALAGNKDFNVKFKKCGEFVGIGTVRADRVRPLVPSSYVLAGDATNASLVVRVTSCAEVSVDDKKSGAARTAQIGVMLASPAGADINNYLLWFVSDNGKLHGKLEAAGIKNGNDQQLKFLFEPLGATGTIVIDVSTPRFPAFPLLGTAPVPGDDTVPFVAHWYADGKHGSLLMNTSFEGLRFGIGGSVQLTPTPGSQLAELLHSPTLTFGFNSYNEWEAADLNAELQ